MIRRYFNRLADVLVHRPAAWLSRTVKISPRLARSLLIWAALIYIVLPNDLIPDWLGIVGRIDDLLVFAYILYRYRKMIDAVHSAINGADPRRPDSNSAGGKPGGHSSDKKDKNNREESARPGDPFLVLGVKRGASKNEIRTAFRQLAAQYHPDKVSHLGPELRELAHQKMIEIQKAYEQIG